MCYYENNCWQRKQNVIYLIYRNSNRKEAENMNEQTRKELLKDTVEEYLRMLDQSSSEFEEEETKELIRFATNELEILIQNGIIDESFNII